MAIVEAPPASSPHASAPRGRDTAIDFLRALCVTGVVLLHAIMVGVTVTDAGPVFENASDGTWWILPVSWALQVMPLFFVIGGFAGFLAHGRGRERGQTDAAFVAARIHRLLRPAVLVIGVAGVLLAALLVAGVPGHLVAIAGFRFAQPLWFLGVFLLCQALLPSLAAAHRRAPVAALGLLAGAAVLVDVVRAHTGADGLGFLNLAFVWLTLQQLGFFLADGTIDALSRRARVAAATTALAALIGAFVTGIYSPDLVANINPPTGALLLVGIVHLTLVSLFRARIARFSRRPIAARFSDFVNRRTMTIYLWHMPMLLAMAGAVALHALATGTVLPEPSSAAWWAGRPVWLLAALVLSALVAVALTRFENRPAPAATGSHRRLALATGTGVGVVALLLVVGTTPVTAGVAVLGLLTALRLARRSRQPARGEGVPDVVRVA